MSFHSIRDTESFMKMKKHTIMSFLFACLLFTAFGCGGSNKPQPNPSSTAKNPAAPSTSAGTLRGFVYYKDPSVSFEPKGAVVVLMTTREAQFVNDKGEFLFDNVAPGTHSVFAFKPGENLFSSLEEALVEVQKEKKVNLLLKESGSLSGKVKKTLPDDTVKPVPSVLIMASAALSFYTHSDEKGFFTFTVLPSDTYKLQVLSPEDEVKGDASVLVESDKTQAMDLMLKQKKEGQTETFSFSFSGKLLDASTAKPVSKAKISTGAKEDTSDEQGIFKFTSLCCVPYSVKIQAEKYLPLELNAIIPSSLNESLELWLVPEKEKKNLDVQVVSDKGKYVKNDKIELAVKVKNSSKLPVYLYFTSGKIFEINLLAGGAKVWSSSSDKDYLPMLFKMLALPGKELSFKAQVPAAKLALGAYQVTGEVFSQGAALVPEKPATFEILEKIEKEEAPKDVTKKTTKKVLRLKK